MFKDTTTRDYDLMKEINRLNSMDWCPSPNDNCACGWCLFFAWQNAYYGGIFSTC